MIDLCSPSCNQGVPPNGLELCEAALWASCPAAQALPHSLYGNLAGKASSNLPHASRVSCSELLACRVVQTGDMGNTLF